MVRGIRENMPCVSIVRLSGPTRKVLGIMGKPRIIKKKAAETFGVILFAIYLLLQFKHKAGAKFKSLLSAGRLLAKYVSILKESGLFLSPNVLQGLEAAINNHQPYVTKQKTKNHPASPINNKRSTIRHHDQSSSITHEPSSGTRLRKVER